MNPSSYLPFLKNVFQCIYVPTALFMNSPLLPILLLDLIEAFVITFLESERDEMDILESVRRFASDTRSRRKRSPRSSRLSSSRLSNTRSARLSNTRSARLSASRLSRK